MKYILRLLRLFFPYWRRIVLSVLISLFTFLSDVGLLALSGWFIFAMAIAGISGSSINYFTPAAGIRAFAISRTIGRYAERLITHDNALRLLVELRVWLYQKLEPLAPARILEFRSGDLLQRLSSDIDVLDNFYVRLLTPLAVAVLGSVVCVSFLAWYHLGAALITLLFLSMAGIGVPLLVKQLGAQAGNELVDAFSQLRSQVIDGIQGMGELQVYGAAERHARSVEQTTGELLRYQSSLSKLKGFSEGAVGLFANLSVWFSILLLIPLVSRGDLSRLDLPMLALFTLAAFEAVAPLPTAFQMLGQTFNAARRVFAIVDAKPKVQEPSAPAQLPENFELCINDLSFKYTPEALPALSEISLKVPERGKLAIVGATGAGKSTLINLLLRFWDYGEGEVSLGGKPLKSFRSEDIHQVFAVVSQDTHLFNTTIRENILIANLKANREQMTEAAAAAQIHDFVMSLPDGYGTYVGEAGVRLSVGQCRRVAIARALLKQSPILILDEPGEGLDPETEHQIMKTILTRMSDRTLLLITHRLVGLEAMDEVIVLDSGRIAERGSHQELMQHSALYRSYHDLLDRPFEI